jgi:outer membrane protein assembly factor BamD (BamD/ComL family)
MSNEKILFSNDLIAVKETAIGYYYLERKGRDSVAIFLIRKNNVIATAKSLRT